MMRRLQLFDFKSSAYDRPTQAWVCGKPPGQTCRIGPSAGGSCRGSAECVPTRKGDRWHCTRPDSAGGHCAEGPLPDGGCAHPISRCAPRPSVRNQRGRIVLWCAALTIGFLALAFVNAGGGAGVPIPGQLSVHHSNVPNCQSCHGAIAGTEGDWVAAAFAAIDPIAESRKCLACHQVGYDAMSTHGVLPKTLHAATAAAEQRAPNGSVPLAVTMSTLLFPLPAQLDDGVPCATCHTEHRGGAFDLQHMANDRCQACHTVKFASLSDGHPDFDRYPYERRTRINFDHHAHINRHFREAGGSSPPTCNTCHGPDAAGRTMLVKDFQEGCAACHGGQITGATRASGPKGIAVLAAPGLDIETLRERGVAIGEWPEFSEAPIPPILRMMLSDDAQGASDLAVVDSLDLLDLTDATEADLEAVARLAWATKSLVHDLAVQGIDTVAARIDGALGQSLDDVAKGRLIGTLPQDVVLSVQQAWFPRLASEIARHRAGEAVPIPGGDDTDDAAPAEPADAAAADDPGEILADDSGDILADDTGDILADDSGDILDDDSGDILADDDGEILDDDSGEILADDSGDILSDDSGDILSDDSGDILADDGAEADAPPAADESPDVEAVATLEPEIDPETWARLGGWYRFDFTLYHRPVDHADRFMRTWIDVAAASFGTAAEPLGTLVFDAMTSEQAPGQCMKCHSVDREAGGQLNAKWKPRRPNEQFKSLTVFAHGPHFGLLTDEGCLTCHAIDPKAPYLKSFADTDPTTFASNFAPMQRELCVGCHEPDEAGDTCTICHNYHAGPALPPALVTVLPIQPKK